MSWGRIDDGFATHPKILALRSKSRRWIWLEVLTYTWRHRSAVVPDGIGDVVRGATPSFLNDCELIGLLEREANGDRVVHDWPLYSDATIEIKVSYYLNKNPEASANEVVRAVGGTRELVLAVVRSYHETTSTNGSAEPETEPPSGSESGSPARAPVPYPKNKEQEQLPTSATPRKRDPVWDFVATIEGEPLPRHRAGRGRIVSDLRTLLADEPLAELKRRHEALAREWGDSKATARALVQHWHRAGEIANGHARPPRPPSGKFSADDLYLQAQQHQRDRNGGPELGTG